MKQPDRIPEHRVPYIVIAGPGSPIICGETYTFVYETALRLAIRFHGLVVNASWYSVHFGRDPLAGLVCLDQAKAKEGRPRKEKIDSLAYTRLFHQRSAGQTRINF